MKTGETVCEAPAIRPTEQSSAPAVRTQNLPLMLPPRPNSDALRFAPVVTLVLWLGCSVVAALGFALPYTRPQAAPMTAEALQVELLDVELSNELLPELEPLPENSLAGPPPADAMVQPSMAQVVAVAMPSPAIAFALPVAGPVRVVKAAQASYTRAETPDAPVASEPPVERLTFGHGVGRQPRPDYPARAQREGQEGAVSVRFVVAENGRVTAAEAVAPSPWPMLNDSALRTIRNRWRFPAGSLRAYEVAIRFVLPQ